MVNSSPARQGFVLMNRSETHHIDRMYENAGEIEDHAALLRNP